MKSTKYSYLLMYAVPILLSIVVYRSGTEFLLSKWLDFDHGAYNHGFLLLLVTLYLLYTNINFDNDISKKGNTIGFCLAALFMIIAFAFEAVTIVSLQVVTFYFFITSLVLAIYGWTIFRKATIPLSLLLFALPIWDFLGPALQEITLNISYLMVTAVGIPALKEGFQIIIPAGTFEVAPSCSGFSYLMAAIPLAILYAVNSFSNKKNIFLVITVIVTASIVANWVRVFIIIVAGQLTDMQHYFVTVEHFNLGWGVFGFMFISLIFFFNKVLEPREDDRCFNLIGQEKIDTPLSESGGIITSAFFFSMSLSVLGLVFIGFQYQVAENTRGIKNKDIAANILIPAVFQSSLPLYDLQPKFNGAIESVYIASEYEPPVQLYHAMVVKQQQGKEIIFSGNRLFAKDQWQLMSVELGDEIRKVELKSKLTGESYLLWSWYRVDGENTGSDIKAKWHELQGYLAGDNSGSIVYLLSPKTADTERNLSLVYRLMVG